LNADQLAAFYSYIKLVFKCWI